MSSTFPRIIILAGPNGAGKSTTAPLLLRDTFAVDEFVNADTIAAGLCAFAPETAALEAGKIMLRRTRELAVRRVDFAFETTLASRTFAPWAARLIETGYAVHLFFLSLPNAEMAVQRVLNRVQRGGHSVPEETIRRRYDAGLSNLFRLYMPVVTSWKIFDNATPGAPLDIAEGRRYTTHVLDERKFAALKERCGHE